MKKIIIIIALVVSALALLPIIGNSFINNSLDSKIELLDKHGIQTIKSSVDSKYLKTSRHYEFIINDTDKFLNYLSQFSDKQIAPYTSALLKGSTLGVDVTYSNIPFTDSISLDIYPLSLSTDIMDNIKKSDESFYDYLKNFFVKKGIFYHIDYNLVSEDFSGFIKNVEENHSLKNGSNLIAEIVDTNFKGNGTLVAPKYLEVDSKRFNIDISNSVEKISISMKGFSSKSTFESRNTYDSLLKVDSIYMNTTGKDSSSINFSDINIKIDSTTAGTKTSIGSSSSFSDMNISTDILNINASNFNSDVEIFDIDKDSFEELSVLLSKSKNNNSLSSINRIKNSALNVLSKGLKINIKDLSIENINVNDEDFKGFSIESMLNLKEDNQLQTKIDYAPLLLITNIDIDFNFRISDKIFSKLSEFQPLALYAQKYAKKDAQSLLFAFTLKDGQFKVNGKVLK